MKKHQVSFILFLLLFSFIYANHRGDSNNGLFFNESKHDFTPLQKSINQTLADFTDIRDGKTYERIKIGEQIWMAENLKFLPYVNNVEEVSMSEPYMYVYGYNGNSVEEAESSTYYKTYGVLYNWTAAMDRNASSNNNPGDVRGICPEGRFLPTEAAWEELYAFIKTNIGGKLKETSHWSFPNTGATNQYGFSALPGGILSGYDNNFFDNTFWGAWWSATEWPYDEQVAWSLYLGHESADVERSARYKNDAFSVRCVKRHQLYSLNLSMADNKQGYVYGSGNYTEGQVIKISAVEKVAHKFINWTGDIEYLDNPDTFSTQLIMPEKDIHIVANFEEIDLKLGEETGELTDERDGKKYNTVKIGEQWWMAENLNYEGVHNYVVGSSSVYGRLYTWSTAMNGEKSSELNPSNVKGICPEGWHLPSKAEWIEFFDYFSGASNAAGKIKEPGLWERYPSIHDNESGFSARPAGLYDRWNGGRYLRTEANWWSATEYWSGNDFAECVSIKDNTSLRQGQEFKSFGLSIRCIKDKEKPLYNINLEAFPDQSGKFTGITQSAYEGTIIPVTAISAVGYNFMNWSGDIEFLENPDSAATKLIMPEKDIHLTANFKKADYWDNLGQLIDSRDNNVYKTIKIGNQEWMAENLRYLPEVNNKSGYYVYYFQGADEELAKATEEYNIYGVLYSLDRALGDSGRIETERNEIQGICPDGWHLPGKEEWEEMRDYLIDNGYNYDGTNTFNKIGKALSNENGWWNYSASGAPGNNDFPEMQNSTGFSALPPSGTYDNDPDFYAIHSRAFWWSSTNGEHWYIDYRFSGLYSDKERGSFAVRCVKDYKEIVIDTDSKLSLLDCSNCYVTVERDIVFVVDDNSRIKEVTLKPGAQLIIRDHVNFNPNTIYLQSDGDNTAIIMGSTESKTIIELQLAATENSKDHYLSIPLKNLTGINQYNNSISVYNEESRSYSNKLSENIELHPGLGYIVDTNNESDSKFSFSGTPNSDEFSTVVTRTLTGTDDMISGYNLVGNPYPSFINWNELYQNSENLLPTIWKPSLKSPTFSSFYVYNSKSHVGVPEDAKAIIYPLSAFWVCVSENTQNENQSFGILNFTNAIRFPNPRSYVHLPGQESPLFRLKISDNNFEDETLVLFHPDASDNFDSFDSEKFPADKGDHLMIYTQVNGHKLVINSLSTLIENDEKREIALGIKINNPGYYDIRLTKWNLSNEYELILTDLTEDLDIILSETNHYYFYSEELKDESRFILTARSINESTGINKLNSTPRVYSQNGIITITGNKAHGASISIFNTMGQKVFNSLMQSDRLEIDNLLKGVYFIRIDNQTHKLIVD